MTTSGDGGRYHIPDPDDDTKPGRADAGGRLEVLSRLYINCTPEERRELVLLADAWFRCDPDGRAIVRGIAYKLALPQ